MDSFEYDIDKLIDSVVAGSFHGTSSASLSAMPAPTSELDEIGRMLDSFDVKLVRGLPEISAPMNRISHQPSPGTGHAAVSSTSSAAVESLKGRSQPSGSSGADTRRSISAARRVGALGADGALVPHVPAGPRSKHAASKPALKCQCVHLPGASPFARVHRPLDSLL
mmetsp:Transcript_52278/g.149810  ORF Transcript_52278/g.149810 Transcript_52278/m.149810 type:complete len:167 (+) Transcript_52278:42-542(+)